MQLIVKTPLCNHNAYCAHLLEHCILWSEKSEDRFLGFTLPFSDTKTKIGYTVFQAKNLKEIHYLQTQIQNPLDVNSIWIEKKILDQELYTQKNEDDILFEKIGKKIYKNNRINPSQNKKTSKKSLLKYHKKRYTDEYMWIIDENNNNTIFKRPTQVKKSIQKKTTNKEQKIEIRVYNTHYIAYVRDYSSLENYVLLYFLDRLYDLFALYKYRYLGDTYYHPTSWLSFYDKHIVFTHSKQLTLSESFFKKAKKYFLKQIEIINMISLEYEILSGTIVRGENVVAIINSLEFKKVGKYFL